MRYNIYLCRKCGGVCAGRESASSFTCCFCGSRNSTQKCVVIAKAIDSKDVPSVIAQIKLSKAKK